MDGRTEGRSDPQMDGRTDVRFYARTKSLLPEMRRNYVGRAERETGIAKEGRSDERKDGRTLRTHRRRRSDVVTVTYAALQSLQDGY